MIIRYTTYIKESIDTKESIKGWLDSMEIKYYTINDDLTVDVDSDVDICDKNLTEIPVKFNKINGNFYCFYNKLTSLKGCPTTINGNFYCSYNKLEDINDLDIEILLKTNLSDIDVKQEVYDKYFEYWITKDIRIFNKLKNVISDNIKQKYYQCFQANNFDLL